MDRIIDQFPADRQAQIRTMLSESLRGVISQTLCKRIGGGRVPAMESCSERGLVEPREAGSKAVAKAELRRMLERAGFQLGG